MREYLTILKTMMLATLFVWVASIVVSSTSYSQEVIVGIDFDKQNTKLKLHSSATEFWKMIGCEDSLQGSRPDEEKNKSYAGKICTEYKGTTSLKNWNDSIDKANSINEDSNITYYATAKFYEELKNYIDSFNWEELAQQADRIDKKIENIDETNLSEEEKDQLQKIKNDLDKIKKDIKESDDKEYIKDQDTLKALEEQLTKFTNSKKCKDLLREIEKFEEKLKDDIYNQAIVKQISELKKEIEQLNDEECNKDLKNLEEKFEKIKLLNKLSKIFEELKQNLNEFGDEIEIIIGQDSFKGQGNHKLLNKGIECNGNTYIYNLVGYDPEKEILKCIKSKNFKILKEGASLHLPTAIEGKSGLSLEALEEWNEYCKKVNELVKTNTKNLRGYIECVHRQCNPTPTNPSSKKFDWFKFNLHTEKTFITERKNYKQTYTSYVDEIFGTDNVNKSKSKLKVNCGISGNGQTIMSLEKELLCCQTLDCIALEKYVLEIEADKTLKIDVRQKFNDFINKTENQNNSSCNQFKKELEELVKQSKEEEEKKREEIEALKAMLTKKKDSMYELYNKCKTSDGTYEEQTGGANSRNASRGKSFKLSCFVNNTNTSITFIRQYIDTFNQFCIKNKNVIPNSMSSVFNEIKDGASYRYVIHSLIGAEIRNHFNNSKKNTLYIPSTDLDICVTVRTARCFIEENRHPDNPSSNRTYCKEQAEKI